MVAHHRLYSLVLLPLLYFSSASANCADKSFAMFQDCLACADTCISSLETFINDCETGYPDYVTTFQKMLAEDAACSDLFFDYVADMRGTDCAENENMFVSFALFSGCLQECSPYCQEMQDGVCNNCSPSAETTNLMTLWAPECSVCNNDGGDNDGGDSDGGDSDGGDSDGGDSDGGDSDGGDNGGGDSSAASFATFMAKAALILSAFMF